MAQAKALESPSKYDDHGMCSVRWGYVSGKQVVVDCPCGKLRETEDFIVENRDLIVAYLKNRLEKIQKNNRENQGFSCHSLFWFSPTSAKRNKGNL